MVTYTISFNDELDVFVREIMKKNKYSNKSEFFRELVLKHYLEKNITRNNSYKEFQNDIEIKKLSDELGKILEKIDLAKIPSLDEQFKDL